MYRISKKKLGLPQDATIEDYKKAVGVYLLAKKTNSIVARKAERLKKGKGRTSLKLSKMLTLADSVFSLWIRNRDNFECVICHSKTNTQNGHLIRRGKKSVRFDERNCNCQCASCNIKHNNYPEIYTQWFINKYGDTAYSYLVSKSLEVKQYTIPELEDLIKKYTLHKDAGSGSM